MYSQHAAYRRSFWFVVCASLFWGTVGVATRFIYAQSATNALALAFWRLALATPVFLIVLCHQRGRHSFQIRWRDLGIMLGMGMMQALYQACYNLAVFSVGVTIATLLALCGAPVFIALYSTCAARRLPSTRILLAMGCALLGTILLVGSGVHPVAGSFSLAGIGIAIFTACCYAVYILLGQRLTALYHPLQINTIAFGSGALLLLGVCLSSSSLVATYPLPSWLLLLYLGCVPTALAYGLFQAGLRSLSATVVSVVTLCEPLAAALLAWLFFHEELGWLGLLGAALLPATLVLLARSQ
ncbi:DMT family transporter [Dictyobacter formicarum]|uniref:Membrane protein n=1 Tax=Dictyobacter formicarum TaxID=2778368 RepID=A0ABQ3VSS9_9CHLR|nr:EamA family transporter [Dictyobacter formicarum]GHO89260.1 membrane protein [Dictyobacter formicarum]